MSDIDIELERRRRLVAQATTKTISVTVELPESVHAYLAVLAPALPVGGTSGKDVAGVATVLRWLAACAADGMRRPGSWERGWVEQACGSDWDAALEQVPNVPYRQLQPRGNGK